MPSLRRKTTVPDMPAEEEACVLSMLEKQTVFMHLHLLDMLDSKLLKENCAVLF